MSTGDIKFGAGSSPTSVNNALQKLAEDGKDHFPTYVNFYMKEIINSLTSEHIVPSLFEKITCCLKRKRLNSRKDFAIQKT